MSKEAFLESVAMPDYNGQFGTRFTLSDYKNYNADIACRMKGKRPGQNLMRDEMIDILIVADMYLTGFDSRYVNTLWVDKPLQFHGLMQAFSRTNRTFGDSKPCGEIVCFRNLRSAVDVAIQLFSSVDGRTGILLCRTYDEYYNGYQDDDSHWNDGYAKLVNVLLDKFEYRHMTQDVVGEDEKAAFVKLFGQILVSRNLLNTFDEFQGNEIMDDRTFTNYKGWYLKLHDEIGASRRTGSGGGDGVLDGLEFRVELINEETVGIDNILERIGREAENPEIRENVINADTLCSIMSAVDASVSIRKKKRLLQLFLAQVNNGGNASAEAFLSLVQGEYDKSVDSVVTELNLKTEARSFISKCVSEGRVITAGNALDDILPPMRRFGSGARHGEIREKSVEAIRKIVEEYCGLLALPNGVAGF